MRRCPTCGAPASSVQTYCTQCGALLPVGESITPPKKNRGCLKTIAIALVILAALGIVAAILTSNGDQNPRVPPSVTAQARIQPTDTPASVNRLPTRIPTTAGPAGSYPDGFAPASWVSSLPSGLALGTISAIYDGDTFDITVHGQTSRYRLYRADTPETYDPVECGGSDAATFVRFALASSDTPGQVWVESAGQRDRYDRTLAYLWFTIDGQPYLLNHLLIDTGWAEDVDYGDTFDPYQDQLAIAANFARQHRLGVWAKCGGFGVSLLAPTAAPADVLFAQPTRPASLRLGSGCVPNYSPCVPSGQSDLDCPDIGFRVQVIGADPYLLDADNNGIGCESY
jgi:endonuclease YncB( thermonuclease family)